MGTTSRAANAAAQRRYEARKRGLIPPASGGPAPCDVPKEPGVVELAVLAEVDGLGLAKSRPGLVASVVAMARVLDNPRLATTHPSAQRRLQEGLAALHKPGEKRSGRLVSVQKLSQREATG